MEPPDFTELPDWCSAWNLLILRNFRIGAVHGTFWFYGTFGLVQRIKLSGFLELPGYCSAQANSIFPALQLVQGDVPAGTLLCALPWQSG